MEAKILFWGLYNVTERWHQKRKSCPISLLSVLLFVNHKLLTSGLFVQTIEDLVENVKTSLVWCLSHST